MRTAKGAARPGSGRRLVVSSLGVLALVVVVALMAWPRATVTAPRGPQAADAAEPGTVAGALVAVRDRGAEPLADSLAEARDAVAVRPSIVGPDVLATAIFLVRPCGDAALGPFARGVQMECFTDDHHVPRDHPDGWHLPRETPRVRFQAAGYRSVERDVPTPTPGVDRVDLGEVVFEPDAKMTVRVTGAPTDGPVLVAFGKHVGHPFTVAELELVGGRGELSLPAPSQEQLIVTAQVPRASGREWFAITSASLRLEPDEQGVVELRALDGVRVEIQVHGPSAALLQHLPVALDPLRAAGAPHVVGEPPTQFADQDGRAVFRVEPGWYGIGLRDVGGWQAMRRRDGAAGALQIVAACTLDVQPVQPLVGVQVSEHGGVAPSLLSVREVVAGKRRGDVPRACHVMSRSDLDAASSVWSWTQGSGARVTSRNALRVQGDIATIEVAAAEALATLRVLADVPQDYFQQLGVVAEPLAGGPAIRVGSAFSPFEAQLPAGDYRLSWRCSGGPGPVLANSVRLVAGETHELRLMPPVLVRWQGTIRNLATLGSFGSVTLLRLGDTWCMGTSPDGSLPFLLQGPPEAVTPMALRLVQLEVELPARISRIDPGTCTFEVSHDLSPDDVVKVRSRGLGAGARSIELRSELTDVRSPAWLGAEFDLPMVPGSERRGRLVEVVDGSDQVTAWFTVRNGTRELLVEPRGRWARLRIEPAGVRATVSIDGDPGMDPRAIAFPTEPCELRVFVADGTTAVHVDLQPGDRVSFAPDEPLMVVR